MNAQNYPSLAYDALASQVFAFRIINFTLSD